MKITILCLLMTSVCLAETVRDWQEGLLRNTATQDVGSRTVSIPAPPGYPQHTRTITQRRTIYVVDVGELRYALVGVGSAPLYVTVGAKVRIALDRQSAYLIDENGKEHRLSIVEKRLKSTAN